MQNPAGFLEPAHVCMQDIAKNECVRDREIGSEIERMGEREEVSVYMYVCK